MKEMQVCFSKVLAQLSQQDSTPAKVRDQILDIVPDLDTDPQSVVEKAHNWIQDRPCALKLELEVARALMHTYSNTGLMRLTLFRQYQESLSRLGYSVEATC